MRTASQVFLATLAIACLTTRGLTHGDAALHLATADALVARGSTALTLDVGDLWVPSRKVAGGLLYDDGTGVRMVASPGMAWTALPGTLLGRALASAPLDDGLAPLFHPGASPRATLRPVQRDPRAQLFSLLGPLFAALACAFIYLAARARELSDRAVWLSVLAFAIGSPMLAYGGSDWTQLPVVAALAFALYWLAERERGRGQSATPIGVALALAVLVRPDTFVLAPLFVVATYFSDRGWRRSPSRSVLRVIGPLAIAALSLAWLGLPASGDGWRPSELPRGVLGLLASPQTGLLVYAPFVVMAPLGLRRGPLLWVLIGAPIALLVIYGGWFDWPASLAYGPRFLIPALPMLALLFGRAAERAFVPAVALVALGALVQLPGALVAHVRLPEGDAYTPAFVDAYRALLDGGAVGELGVDCAATYTPLFAWVALGAALIGLAREANALRRGLQG